MEQLKLFENLENKKKPSEEENSVIKQLRELSSKAHIIETYYSLNENPEYYGYIYDRFIQAPDHKNAYILALVQNFTRYNYHIPGDSIETTMLNISISNPFKRNIKDIEPRNFHEDYAEEFFQTIWQNKDLKTLKEELGKLNPNAIRYLVEFEYEGRTRNTLYGPRIHETIEEVIQELIERPYTRRAWIQILENEDNKLLKPLREKKTTIEYPCAVGFGFHIRPVGDTNILNMNVILRSNNLPLTICYDFYNFTRLFEEVYNILSKHIPQLKVGVYNHIAVSAHSFEKEFSLVDKIFDFVIKEFKS